MENTKWTPGPWFVYDPETLKITPDGEGLFVGAGEAEGEYLSAEGCLVTAAEPYSDYERSKANARLIAQAPTLYESLEAIMGFVESGVLVRDISHDDDPGWALRQIPLITDLARARLALAGASGESLKPLRPTFPSLPEDAG